MKREKILEENDKPVDKSKPANMHNWSSKRKADRKNLKSNTKKKHIKKISIIKTINLTNHINVR